MMAVMLFPTTMSRKAFLFPNIPGRVEPAQLVYVTWHSNSNVTILNEISSDSRTFSGNRVSTLPVYINNYVVGSNTAIFVLYRQSSVCEGENSEPMDAGPNLCHIIPAEFFHYRFIWRTPDVGTQNFILIVARVTDTKHLLLDSKPLPNSAQWEGVFAAANYTVGNVPVSVGDHTLASGGAYTFACYVYGIGKSSSYMHLAGFQYCGPEANERTYEDLVDTDCDGKVEGYSSNIVTQAPSSSSERNLVFIIVPILLCGIVLGIAIKLCTKRRSQQATAAATDATDATDASAPKGVSQSGAPDSDAKGYDTGGSGWNGMSGTDHVPGSTKAAA